MSYLDFHLKLVLISVNFKKNQKPIMLASNKNTPSHKGFAFDVIFQTTQYNLLLMRYI